MAVSLTGLVLSMPPRLRSSLQTAATIGTGSSASRAIWLVGTGSWGATATSTSRTPDSPSARPTATATSAVIESMSIGCVHPIKFAGPAVSCHIMPGIEPASRYTELRRQEAASPKALFAVDAICGPDSPVHDLAELIAVAAAAVEAGSGHLLDPPQVIFPNRAVPLVLVPAAS